ncbi:DUF899 domain-containing protein [Myceligenerans indicum]|uniref:DUF899 domain-containing protein n=1 Tax=Myceligenerans indicum TaxID=2593663 RepID=A0ABS1LHS6_9MICO|nr:DUF899 domain-containing protein [Myceligenerans indicum]MBL0885609.1 DUF899 domain-containing protein [Myceligenerans indicum]
MIPTVDRETWWTARRAFLDEEKEFTRARDRLSARRRELPMTEVSKTYTLRGPEGPVGLEDLFAGRRQLIVYHFMAKFSPTEWCPICSFWVDNIGHLAHFRARDTEIVVVSPEDLADGLAYRDAMGWSLPWYSCADSDFYDDLHQVLDDGGEPEAPGISAFLRDEGRVLYAYSTFRRGSDILNGTYNYLDITPLGRQETDPEDPMGWLRPHDSYDGACDTADERACGCHA